MKEREAAGQADSPQVCVLPEMNEGFGRSVLIVEDSTDIRNLLVTLLEMAGYAAVACATAEEGLDALREQVFDFVLTDYALPNRTGGWLLQQARAEGLLDATPATVITAHPNPVGVDGFDIIRKPFDLDDLVGHVRRRLEDRSPGAPRFPGGRGRPRQCGYGDGDDPEPIELILYVTEATPNSASAIKDIERILSGYGSDRFRLTIRDVDAGSEAADAACPALPRRSPGPRTFILGHITNPDLLMALLRGGGAGS
jgi:two-component system response regulator GlrR